MKFLSVLTRTFKRPVMFRRNRCSLEFQSCQDFEPVVFEDKVGIGVGQSHKALRDFEPQTEYVWVFDDDNILTDWRFVERVRNLARIKLPDLIMCPVLYDGKRVPAPWPVKQGDHPHVDMMCPVVSRKAYNQYKAKFGLHYAGDLDFIYAMLADHLSIETYDDALVIGESQRVSRGLTE